MKKYLIVAIIATISILLGCSKEKTSLIDTDEPDPIQLRSGGSVFILDGEVVDSSEINWSSDYLNIVIGIFGEDTVLVFSNDAALITWATSSSAQGEFFLELLDIKDTALIVAEEMDEFDYLEEHGEHSREFQDFLDSFLHGQSRGATHLFEDDEYLGDNQMYYTSKAYVGNKMNNKTSSMQFAFIGGMLADWKWWGGRKFWYWTVYFGYHPRLPNYNDKATSILIY